MTFAEFKTLFPAQGQVTEANFTGLLLQAETVVQDLMVYSVDELNETGLAAYNAALALQIDYIAGEDGSTEGNITSQTINGATTTFALSAAGADALRVSPLAKAKLRGSGLCVRF